MEISDKNRELFESIMESLHRLNTFSQYRKKGIYIWVGPAFMQFLWAARHDLDPNGLLMNLSEDRCRNIMGYPITNTSILPPNWMAVIDGTEMRTIQWLELKEEK